MKDITNKNHNIIKKENIVKLNKLLDCIDDVVEKNGNYYIIYKSNVMEIYPENYIRLTKGVDVSKAKTIHLNPNIDIEKDENINVIINNVLESK